MSFRFMLVLVISSLLLGSQVFASDPISTDEALQILRINTDTAFVLQEIQHLQKDEKHLLQQCFSAGVISRRVWQLVQDAGTMKSLPIDSQDCITSETSNQYARVCSSVLNAINGVYADSKELAGLCSRSPLGEFNPFSRARVHKKMLKRLDSIQASLTTLADQLKPDVHLALGALIDSVTVP